MKMSKSALIVMAVLTLAGLVMCPLLYVYVGPHFSQNQIDTLIILASICGGSALYTFIVGELTHNNSQMDKLWSILPAVYTWVVAIKGNMQPRLIIMAALATLWAIRLTMNFARKGAYKLKFWAGEEDYRWKVLRESEIFKGHPFRWMLFSFFFISIYQNLIVLLTTIPALASMEGALPLNYVDYIAAGLTAFFILYETAADEQQWKFQIEKWAMINAGMKLEDLPEPYNKGFNTVGLWNVSRHPNYLGEQGTWVAFFLFSVGALHAFNYSIAGCLLLIVLFIGSSNMSESISLTKYPEYVVYCQKVSKFFPWKKYRK